MTDKTAVKLELLKIAAQLTSTKFKEGDDFEQVFKDCFALALHLFEQEPEPMQPTPKSQLAFGVITV